MKLFRFDVGVGQPIDNFGSVNVVFSRIARPSAEARVSCMHLGAHGKVGDHQAATPQLFLVVQGEGWVCGAARDRIPITAGTAAFWEKDEWHASGTETGMAAIVIESEILDPARFMPEKE
jgi:quercetin dioxygenase-like cupin family protein